MSALGVLLTAVRNRWCWPVGLVSVLLYSWVFVDARLYSDALLQIVYAGMECYGWWHWQRAPREASRPGVHAARRTEIAVPLVLGAVGAVLLGWAMARLTDAALPWLDASLTALSLVAQFWMARLIRANWPLWIAVDVAYVGVYLSRDLPVTTALYAGFVVLAAYGWYAWGKREIAVGVPEPTRD